MDRPPGTPRGLIALGWLSMAAIVGTTLVTEPQPALHGDGLGVTLGLVAFVAGLFLSRPLRKVPPARRVAGLVLVGASSCVLAAFQPDGPGFAGIYVVFVAGGMWLGRTAALVVCGGSLAALVAVVIFGDHHPGIVAGLIFSVLPWFLIMRLVRRLTGVVEELRESRAAQIEAAALAERARLARDLHDVLAHSLSALALQLEATRLRTQDPEIEHAHRLAVSGLTEARQAIATLRGDELPGIEDLARGFPGATLTVTGEPLEASSEARLALYRTAQEALTNVRRHSAAERVELRLDHAADGTTLTVQDHGAAPAAPNGDGYGLTGMRERAELLGGRLSAGPTTDGFKVELWLPA